MRKKLESSKVLEQKGRSLVELLGVLAVAGVLSVAGLYGFGYAMEKWRENETLDRYAKVVAGARTSQILEGENEGYRTKYLVSADGITHELRDAFERQPVDIRKVISNVGDDLVIDEHGGYLLAPQKGPFNQFNPKPDDEGYELPADYEPKEVEIWVDVRTPSAFTVHARNLTFNACKRIVQSNLGHSWGYESSYDNDLNDEVSLSKWYTAPQLHNDSDAKALCSEIVKDNTKDLVLWFGSVECLGGQICAQPPRPVCPSGNELDECDKANPCGDDEYCSNGCCYSNNELLEPKITAPDECPSGTTLCVGANGSDCCEAGEYCDSGICTDVCPSGKSVPECSSDSECGEDEICESGCCVDNKCDGKAICSSNAECPTGYSCSAEGCCEAICKNGAKTCSRETDCAEGQICTGGCCEFPCRYCTEDANCGSGYVCEGNCCAKSECELCSSDGDCSSGEICVNECCVKPQCEAPECSNNEDCGENYVCNGGCCVDNGCDACTTDEDCSLGQSCNSGCCGAKPFVVCPEGVTPCENAKDCASGEMCNSGCCEQMECPSRMACTSDYDCVVPEEVALKNNWKTQGKCNMVTQCCQMLDCNRRDMCAERGMDRLYDGTCCPKGHSWFNCGGCATNPTYEDECGIERPISKACCDGPTNAPAGCVGTGFFSGFSFPSNYPHCYKNFPDAYNRCCALACANEDGSTNGVCCDTNAGDKAVDGICCKAGSASTLHCCQGHGYTWASSNLKGAGNRGTSGQEGRDGVCCGMPGSSSGGATTKNEAYIPYVPDQRLDTNKASALCVPTGKVLAKSSLSKTYSTRDPMRSPGSETYY